jgi:hypothetical protein
MTTIIRPAGRACLAAGVFLLPACEPRPEDAGAKAAPRPEAESSAAPEQATSRRFVESEWETLWVYGGDESDTTLLIPFALTAAGGNVYVADRAEPRVVAIRAADGALAWIAGRRGGGPDEFERVDAIAATADGGVMVADGGNGRIAILDREGRTRGYIRPEGVPIFLTLCPLADGSVAIGTGGPANPVVHVAPDGTIIDHPRLPWADLNEMYPAAPRQGIFAPEPDGSGCAYTLALGRGFSRFSGGRFTAAQRYVEWFELPESELTPSYPGQPPNEQLKPGWTEAVRGVAVDADQLVVAFWGRSRDRGRLLDVYDRRTGRYRHSLRSPEPVQRMAHSGSTYFFLQTRGGYPALVAARVHPSAAERDRTGR